IGEGSPSKFDADLRALGLSERIRFLGHRDDMPACFAALDIVVCASTKGEGLTGALREALAVARPVISTDVSGNREIVIANETGLLVPPANSEAIAEAMLTLLRQPELGARLGKRGCELIAERFDNRKRVEKIENLYLTILGEKAARNA
ncbi:MAG: glycosyltransferase, partial [bacterium]